MVSTKENSVQGGVIREQDRRGLYLLALAVIVGLALLSVIVVPRGSALKRCSAALSSQAKDDCLSSLAEATLNYSYCGYLPSGLADGCYSYIAMNSSNATICTKLSSVSLSSACIEAIANSTGKYGLCSMLSGQYGSACFYGAAIKERNGQLCSDIGNSSLAETCRYSLDFDNAVTSLNQSYCTLIANNTDQNVSLAIINNAKASGINNVENIEYALTYSAFIGNQILGPRDLCYIGLSMYSSNPAYCSDLRNENFSALCGSVARYSISSNQSQAAGPGSNAIVNYTQLLNGCTSATSDKQQCQYTVLLSEAVVTGNYLICGSFGNESLSDECYYSIAQDKNNVTYCSYIKNTTANSACVFGVRNGANITAMDNEV